MSIRAIAATFSLLLMIFFASSCQVNGAKVPIAANNPTNTAPPLADTPTFATPSPSVVPSQTPRPSATPEPAPTAAGTQAPLTVGGPWLLYHRILLYPEGGFFEVLFASNQDGSGSRIIYEQACETSLPVAVAADPANRLVMLNGKFVLINLDQAVAQIVAPDCRTSFTGSAESGLLAVIDRAAAEFRVYALPEGRLRSESPIPACSPPAQACAVDTYHGQWLAQWDPGGRYLIFPVNREEAGTDLYLYDSQNDAARQLPGIPGRVIRIWWSPGGTNILLGVSSGDDFLIASFWAISLADGDVRQVSTGEGFFGDVDLLDWLDEHRFLFYSGSLQHVVTVGASNLRMLDIRSNQVTTFLGDGFLRAGLDRQTGVVGMIVAVYNSQYEDGVYLIPAAQPTPQRIAPVETEGIYNTFWDESLRLFVSDDPCRDGEQGFRAFDSQGKWHCAPVPYPAETPLALDSPSPDGQWRAVMKEGLWVERTGKPAVKVQDATPTQVIWRPDSGGFFFIAANSLYYLSLPDLAVHALDQPNQLENGLRWGSSQVEYLWIEK